MLFLYYLCQLCCCIAFNGVYILHYCQRPNVEQSGSSIKSVILLDFCLICAVCIIFIEFRFQIGFVFASTEDD